MSDLKHAASGGQLYVLGSQSSCSSKGGNHPQPSRFARGCVSAGSPAMQKPVGCEPMAHTWAQQQGRLSPELVGYSVLSQHHSRSCSAQH